MCSLSPDLPSRLSIDACLSCRHKYSRLYIYLVPLYQSSNTPLGRKVFMHMFAGGAEGPVAHEQKLHLVPVSSVALTVGFLHDKPMSGKLGLLSCDIAGATFPTICRDIVDGSR